MYMFSEPTNHGKVAYIFSSFAQEDNRLLTMLAKHLSVLQVRGLIAHWHHRNISAGSDWQKDITDQLNRSDIILLLLSPDFLASEYCRDIEMTQCPGPI